jgi:hypothetical protein
LHFEKGPVALEGCFKVREQSLQVKQAARTLAKLGGANSTHEKSELIATEQSPDASRDSIKEVREGV